MASVWHARVRAAVWAVSGAVVALAASVVAVLAPTGCRGNQAQPANILVISIDTLRADHLGVYGYGRDTSPKIDAFGAQAVVFERAYATCYHTADSHMSIFTSQYPSVHRVQNATDPNQPLVVLSSLIPTFTEVLSEHGYRTVGFHGGGNVGGGYGFARGFDSYTYAADRVDAALEWLEQNDDHERPFFMFFHTYHTHDPYTPLPPYDSLYDPDYTGDVNADKARFDAVIAEQGFVRARELFWDAVDPEDPSDLAHVIALYDGEINEVDLQIGRLLDLVGARFSNTVVVLLSDHGEEFYEHGRFLHNQLYEECLRVPLIIRAPGLGSPGRVGEWVSLIDIAPTVLDLVGIEAPTSFRGRSLRGVIDGNDSRAEVFAEKIWETAENRLQESTPRHMALYSHGLKGIMKESLELYELGSDPGEQHDLGGDSPAAVKIVRRLNELTAENNRRMTSFYPNGDAAGHQLSEEEIEQLKALGYLE